MHVALALLLARCDGPHRVDGRLSLYAWARNTTAISRVAEFGVWRGGNAAKLLRILSPSRLVLIDAWLGKGAFDPTHNRYTPENEGFVRDRFKTEISAGRVTVRKGLTNVAMMQLARADEKFDLVYIDASHAYGATRYELSMATYLVAPGGLLCGHDFGVTDIGLPGGVTDAVMAFAFEAGWSLAAVSVLDAPQRSFCLSRLSTECLATMDPNVQRYYQKAGAREKQLQDSPVGVMLGKRGKHTNAGAVSE